MTKTKSKSNTSTIDGWLDVSIDGFKAQNAGRDPAHIVKELLQNSLDAIGDHFGHVILGFVKSKAINGVQVNCDDSGEGIDDIGNIRTMFWTSKTDSHTKRGRMGRGFKEVLSLSECGHVDSKEHGILFTRDSKGNRVARKYTQTTPVNGTTVVMEIPWKHDTIKHLEEYFSHVLVPSNIQLSVNNKTIPSRRADYTIEATLPTEIFENSVWRKPSHKTSVELVKTVGAEQPMVYEMGIPVCSAEWEQPYHINVLQRVPMNPNRDAVASGYIQKLHKACLPTLLPIMTSEETRSEWVGMAAKNADETVQKEVVKKAFGENAVREVPAMGKRDFNEDARDIGKEVVPLRIMSSGFKEIAINHLPTARQVVLDDHHRKIEQASTVGFKPEDKMNQEREKLIQEAGGHTRVNRILRFAQWFCATLLDIDEESITVQVAPLSPVGAIATWSIDDILTLGIDWPVFWKDPFSDQSLATFIHEAAHHLAMHHGRSFHQEVERLAGKAARLMIKDHTYVSQHWGDLIA